MLEGEITDPFAPLTDGEKLEGERPKAKVAEKVPILPVPEDAAPVDGFKIPGKGGKPTRLWAYRDRDGQLLGYDARFEWVADGKAQKDVMPVTFCQQGDKRGWRSRSFPVPRPLYGLHDLAGRPDAPVVIAEGCKSADAAGRLLPDRVPVSWPGGSKAMGAADWSPLAGRDILIWPDRDRQRRLDGTELPYDEQPGSIAAQNIVDKLRPIAGSISVLDLETHECLGGWDAADALAEGWDTARAAAFVDAHARTIDLAAPGTVLPPNFEHGADGLYFAEDPESRIRLCGRLKVLAKTRDLTSHGWGLLLSWNDHDGRAHRWSMPTSLTSGDGSAIRETLLEGGLFVSSAAKARTRFLQFLSSVDTPKRARAVVKVGWSGAAFALPETTIGDTPDDRVVYQQAETAAHHYTAAGTLAEWQEHVAKPAIGNSRLLFMISAAFAGPVLLPAFEEGSGYNIVGKSSSGKTTGLRAAASVWGPPAFIRNWRATSNGLEGVATQHNETLLCLDELSQVEPREAGAIAYMLANGQGKARASRTGAGRAAATWKVIYLSTGEVGLSNVMLDDRKARAPMAGQEVRILDVPADAGRGMGLFENTHGSSPEAFSRQLASAAATYYGTASIEYLTRLALIRDTIGDAVAGTIARFAEAYVPDGADGQVLRGGRKFGLVAAAGELAVALGILPWPRDEAFRACGVMFRAWMDRRGGSGSAEVRNLIGQVRAFLEAHGESRFSSVDDDVERARLTINRAGFWRNALNDQGETVREFLILPTVFKDEICRGHDLNAAVAALKGIGALKLGSGGKSSQKPRLPGFGTSTRVWVIGPEIFDD